MLLDGDAVVLAGATGRVGGMTLQTLLREGARVLLVSRTAQRAQEAINGFVAARDRERVIPFTADLSVAADGERVTDTALERFKRLDAVVSLAGGGYRFEPLVESTLANLRASVTGQLEVTYNLMLPALRAMLNQPFREDARSRGRLVQVTAGSSRQPQPNLAIMGAAKAGVNVLMLGIAREHKADGIVANALVLGGVATEAARNYMSEQELAAAVQPQEVAEVLAFLASDRGSGINGALVDVNAREVD